MTANSPGAFMLSATLHTAAVILALWLGYVTRSDDPPEKILELVAGEGDNFMATEAPALGTPGGLTTNIPKVAEPKPAPPEPVRPPTPPPTTPPVTTPTTPPDKPLPDFAKQIRRNIIVGESKAKQSIKKDRDAEKKRADEEAKRMTKEEYDRTHKASNSAPTKVASSKSPKIDTEGIAKGVVGGSTKNKVGGAGGKALTSDNADVLAAYEKLLRDRLRREFNAPPGLSDRLKVEIEVRSNADGSLTGARVVTSSGSAEYDRAVLDAIRSVKMPARPDKKGQSVSFIFSMSERE
ncbi:MAG: cell envelope integrity protein TolA [Opitutaceae bacterium]